jgi:predicted permease
MSAVVEVVVPVFAIIALGYLAARWRLMAEAGFRGLTGFTFSVAAPALLFSGGTQPHQGGSGAAVAFLVGVLAIYGIGMALGRGLLRLRLAEANMLGLSCAFGNTVMMGIPLILAAYGPAGLPPMLAILAFHTLVILGLATVVAEVAQQAGGAPWRRVLKATLLGVVRNPVVMAVFAALVWSGLSLPVPGALRRTLELLGAAAPPVALFCLGGSLFGLSVRAAWRETALICAVKLLAMPGIIWLLCLWMGLSRPETAVAVTLAALPTGANAFILAQRYQTGADRSGAAVVVSTALSVLTLAALIGWFRG